MVIRISFYSNTKKFFQKTIDNVKSFLSGGGGGGYRKLPKNSPLPRGEHIELEAKQEEPEKLNRKESEKGMVKSSSNVKHGENILGNLMKHVEENQGPRGNRIRKSKNENAQNHQVCDKRSYLVSEKLKELAMIDKSNEDALDIEEVLHYYSRLTCPAYRDIVDKFFVDMYSGFFRSSIQISST